MRRVKMQLRRMSADDVPHCSLKTMRLIPAATVHFLVCPNAVGFNLPRLLQAL